MIMQAAHTSQYRPPLPDPMGKKSHRHPNVPAFGSAFLDRIGLSLGRRAKAIKHKSWGFECTRNHEADGIERLDVSLEEVGSALVRLRIWEDGGVWLAVHQPGRRNEPGWAFEYTGRGSLSAFDSSVVISKFEETMSLVSSITGGYGEDGPDDLTALWKDAGLKRES